ncbi:HPr kinase/phosphorylase [Methylobacterium sp. E-066]|uniref:HPr kinase/phosphorylase n=1 Tax=Methylobacterium sp. E-066 TaxID=2836584 RepID=UPI001FBA666E|nr:HPr kinase/phosphatase C-terminal domain-containing protein [Methylobacterium sp. E-066]MCJ2141436.1 HPr kinase/phosphatase C-terminal domain-containing protein [Methylobacterium sp. E-066]
MPSLHAACVALGESGVLIRGPSGAGKSSLALLLAAESDGAFVADDRVVCERRAGALVARPHDALVGQVEIHGQGILPVQELGLAIRPEAIVRLAIDLVAESPRLPEPLADAEILDLRIPRLVLDRGVRNAGLAPLLIRAALRKQRP